MPTVIKIDPNNARFHDDENKALIEKSLTELGAGRSILIDGEDYVIAGNGVMEAAKKQGIKVTVIETDGTELIAIKRTDLKYNDKKRKELAIVDNAATDKSRFIEDVFETEYFQEVDIKEWGYNILKAPDYEDLIGDYKNKPATMKITFEAPEQLQKAEIDIQELIDRKYQGAYFSVSCGEI